MNEEAMTLLIKRDAPRSRFGYKVVVNYKFRTIQSMSEYFERWRAAQERHENEVQAIKAAQKKARANFVNPFEVGQVFYDSWGYDQTNIDFYQVTQVGNKSVKIRNISQIMTRAAGYMCEYVRPDIGNFIGEEETKIISFDSKCIAHVNGYRGWLSVWDRQEIYQSHYA